MSIFLDTNVPMYVGGDDHPNRQRADDFLASARRGDVELCTSTEVLQEILNRYSKMGKIDLAAAVYDIAIRACVTIYPMTIVDTDLARDLLFRFRGFSARDALHVAVMLNNNVTEIASFDADFDRIPGIRRVTL